MSTKKITNKNYNAMPTWKLKEILDSHHTTGIDGADYHSIREYLEDEMYKRQNAASEKDLQAFMLYQKELFKHQYRRK